MMKLDDLLSTLSRQHGHDPLSGLEDAVWRALQKRARALSIASIGAAGAVTVIVITTSFFFSQTITREAQFRALLVQGNPGNVNMPMENAF